MVAALSTFPISTFPVNRLHPSIPARTTPQMPGDSLSTDKLHEAAKDFEAVFLASAFKSMFSGIETEGAFGGGLGEQMFRELLADEYAKDVVLTGGIGVADQIIQEMLSMQEIEK